MINGKIQNWHVPVFHVTVLQGIGKEGILSEVSKSLNWYRLNNAPWLHNYDDNNHIDNKIKLYNSDFSPPYLQYPILSDTMFQVQVWMKIRCDVQKTYAD